MALRLLGFLLVLGLTAAPAGGAVHEKFKIAGTVVKIHAAQLDIKALDGATYEIDMDDATVFTRQHQKVAKSELKTGAKVLVQAVGHDMFDLVAFEVQLQ